MWLLMAVAFGAHVMASSGREVQAPRIEPNQICASTDSLFVGPCRSLRARLVPGADNIVIRIWPVGTRRLLGYAGRALECRLPSNLEVLMKQGQTVFADVAVRPVSPARAGAMQFVCIASIEHLRIATDE